MRVDGVEIIDGDRIRDAELAQKDAVLLRRLRHVGDKGRRLFHLVELWNGRVSNAFDCRGFEMDGRNFGDEFRAVDFSRPAITPSRSSSAILPASVETAFTWSIRPYHKARRCN